MIYAIVVTFNPDLNRLVKVLSSLQAQVKHIQVVDNGSANADQLAAAAASIPSVDLLRLERNFGVGVAFNHGIDAALAAGCEAVLLMDQDSIPLAGMVSNLLLGLERLRARNASVAAIGPRFIDRRTGNLSRHVIFAFWHVGRVDCLSLDQPVKVDYLITSGSLVPAEALRAIGPFDENLFIDHVDTEWVLRAKSKGYLAYGDCAALMEHDLGEFRRRIWLWRWREVPIHKPFRYYYIFRNSIWLYGMPHASAAWKRVDAMRLLQIVVFMTIFHPQRWAVLRMIVRGMLDGLHKRMGKLPNR